MAENQHDRTEQPTLKRRREARKRGQVARSRDLSLAVSLLGLTAAVGVFGPGMLGRLRSMVSDGLLALADVARRDVQAGDIVSLMVTNGLTFTGIVGPLMGAAVLVAVVAGVGQSGFHLSTEALELNWGRLNPARGLKRLSVGQAGPETLRACLAAVVLTTIAWSIGRALMADAVRFPGMAPSTSAGRGWSDMVAVLWRGGFALLALGAADYAFHRWRLTQSLRMTKREVRDEARLNEGNPEIKARVRRTAREMVRRRMLKAAAKATVVITNPTHYAVALEYRRDKTPAPVVVAKGRDLVAGRIREIARVNGVPIVENAPLARALHKGADVGDTIPADLFGAVAEVLAYLIRIKQLML
jgi:flagellar biosynthesis protein FlhB